MIALKEAVDSIDRQNYVLEMAKRNRILFFLDKNNNFLALVTYVITDNPNALVGEERRENIWSIPTDNEGGQYVVLDRVISGLNNKRMCFQIGRDIVGQIRILYPYKQVLWFSRRRENAICPKSSQCIGI